MAEQQRTRHRLKVLDLFNLTRINPAALQADLRGANRIISVVEARSRSISELVFTSLTAAQKSVYEPLGIDCAQPLPDPVLIRERGFYAARDYVLQCAGLDPESLGQRLALPG